jgi:hypothetical protein
MFARAAHLALAEKDAKLSNEVCWTGAVYGAGRQVLPACRHAVDLEPQNAGYRDSRGVALATSGSLREAIPDFEAYVAAAGTAEHKIERRRLWIRELRVGRQPFDEVTLRTLRNERFDFR